MTQLIKKHTQFNRKYQTKDFKGLAHMLPYFSDNDYQCLLWIGPFTRTIVCTNF